MKSKVLVKWEFSIYQGFSNTTCILTIKTVWFWGLFSTINTMNYSIPMHHNHSKYFENWDNLISSGKKVSL